MKGQIEISFQWIMVAIAGAAFLLIFFFTFKACTQVGNAQIEGTTLKAAATTLSATAWQAEVTKNITLDATADCIGGVITLHQGNSAQQLDLVPAFLPGTMHDPQLITHQIALTLPGVPPIVLGSVLYALDDNTDYYVVKEGNYRQLAALLGARVKLVDANQVSSVSGKNIVIASYTQLTAAPQNARGIYITNDHISFFQSKNGAWSQIGQPIPSAGDVLAGGAVASADPKLFACGQAVTAKRMKYLLQEYVARNNDLIPLAGDKCRSLLSDSASVMSSTSSIFSSNIMTYQQALYSAGCPVI